MPNNSNKSTSRKLRRGQTDAEALLWFMLRNRQLVGAKFRRQYPIGPYVADLVSLEHRLVVEADGGQHCEQETRDLVRTHYMNQQGFRVVRFWNNQILQEIENVMEQIHLELQNGPHPPLRGDLSQRER